MPFDFGATARLTAECRDPGGTLTTAATAVVTIGLPDGTTSTAAAIEEPDGSGRYQADYVTTASGRHTVRWVFTGPSDAYTDVMDVRPAQSTAIYSLAEARSHLKLTRHDQDDEVRTWVETTTEAVEWFVGPVTVRTVTERHSVKVAGVLALRKVPALELTAVVPVLSGAGTYDVDGLDLDGDTGIVRRKDGGDFHGPLDVVYQAGRRIVTSDIASAGKIILQHLWRTQQGPGRPQPGTGDFDVTEPIPGLGYAIPNRAMQLLSPKQLPPGIA
ncbi:hypothetical protein P3L51_24460 [Streptomyces sp. PSRA5]|uniref:hypothetical protein n=1 Tax=Streptomyces panacea TaxID=3035064 RepID=UPI00339D29C1